MVVGINKVEVEVLEPILIICYIDLNEIYFSLRGICYSSDECAGITGSYADGKCAQGFGVCCVIR